MQQIKPNMAARFRGNWQLHVMVLIPLCLLIVYSYVPMAGIVLAFQDFKPAKGILGSDWIGLQNFKLLFSIQGFHNAVRNSFVIATGKILLNIVIPVTFALLLNEMRNQRIKKSVQTIVYMPHFISWVLMASIILRLLSINGVTNKLLNMLGVPSQVFLANKRMFQPIILITDVWKEFGYGTIIYLAAITGVDSMLYEAAAIDGAGYWKRMLHVTLPAILPTIILMSTLALGRILDAGFEQIFNLYSPAVYETADIIDTFVYRMAFANMQYSMSTAAGLMKNVISCILIIVSHRLSFRLSGYRVF